MPLESPSAAPLRILIVEDEPDDADLMLDAMRRDGLDVAAVRVDTEAGFLAQLDAQPDLILSDYTLPGFGATHALELLQASGRTIPFIVVTGSIGDEAAVTCMKHGATDYLLKDRLVRLGQAVRQALEMRRLDGSERQSQQALRESHKRFRALFENALDATFVLDDAGRVIDANPAACALMGYERVELLGVTVESLVPNEDVRPARAAWRRLIQTGASTGEYRLRTRNGSPVDVELRAVANVVPGVHVAALRDISARRKVAEAQAWLAAIVESSDDAIIGKRLDGRITSWNRGAERLYGYRPDEVIGRSISVIFPPDRSDELATILDGLRAGERRTHYQTSRVRKDGRVLAVSVSLFPIKDAGGEVIGAASIARDVTVERERQQQAAQSERLRALGQLAGGVAHDLNQVLTLILGYGELVHGALEDSVPDRVALREMTDIITQAAADGGETVKRLLTFARTRSEEPRDLVDVGALLDDVARLTAPRWRDASQAEGRPISLSVEAGGGAYVLGSASQLREALINLIFNAVDALPRGGTVRLVGYRAANEVVIEVIDSGVGMGCEVQERVFEPFFTTKGERGSGLGLAAVFGIVEGHHGRIAVQSEPGRGTIFALRFPAADGHRSIPQPQHRAGGAHRALGVLVVDDEPALANLVVAILAGHDVTPATSGEEAVRALSARRFDLVISDLGLGDGMNGWQLAEHVQQHYPGLPVVLATGWGAGIVPEDARRRGIHAVLTKPFRLETLRRMVEDIVQAVPDACSPAAPVIK